MSSVLPVRSGTAWLLGLVWFCMQVGGYGQLLWLPQIIKGASGLSPLAVGGLSMFPALASTAAMVLVAAHSDRSGERHWHVALSFLAAGAGFVATAGAVGSRLLATAALSLVAVGISGSFGPFWGLSTAALRGPSTASAIALALVSAVGSAGGIAGPYVIGLIKDATGSFAGALAGFAVLMLAGALLVLMVRRPSPRETLLQGLPSES